MISRVLMNWIHEVLSINTSHTECEQYAIRCRSVRRCRFTKLNSWIHVWWRPGWMMQLHLSRQDILV